MLDLNQVDLDHLVQALEDHTQSGDWWLDRRSGEVALRDKPLREEAEERRLVFIQPIAAEESDAELREFVSRVVDGGARELLESAIVDKEAFQRFEERLRELPRLGAVWSRVHHAYLRRRALEWLVGEGLIARDAVLADQIAWGALEQRALQKAGELAGLIRLLRRRKLRTIVEIGTARGGTLYAWCELAEPDAVLVSIDLPGGPFGGGYAESEIPRLHSLAKPGQTLHLLRRDSHVLSTQSEVATLLGRRRIDFLLIDADHSYEGVKRDFELYSPFVRRGGLIAFHDILPHPTLPECEVDRLWRELKPRHRYVEFFEPEDDRGWGQWGGIGVLFW